MSSSTSKGGAPEREPARRFATEVRRAVMRTDRAAMRAALEELLERAQALDGFCGAQVRGRAVSARDAASMDAAVRASWHDVLSDLDIKLDMRVSPGDAVAYLTPAGAAQLGFERAAILGMQLGGTEREPLYRVVRRDGMRFDVSVRLIVDESCPGAGLEPAREPEIRPEGRFWPNLGLAHADAFWFVQVQALGKLLRGDYLIAAHLANCQVNETLVMQMRMRDDAKGTNVHRYGDREALEYARHATAEFICAHDATFADIAQRLCGAAGAYDALMPGMSRGYEPRAGAFYALWRHYQEGLRAQTQQRTGVDGRR